METRVVFLESAHLGVEHVAFREVYVSRKAGRGQRSPRLNRAFNALGGVDCPHAFVACGAEGAEPTEALKDGFDDGTITTPATPESETPEDEIAPAPTSRDLLCYAARYPDLAAVFGEDTDALLRHWSSKGRAEGRDPYCAG